MADAKVQIGNSADFLEGTSVDTSAGSNLFREGVVVSDESNGAARARVLNAEPVTSDYGLTVRTVGPVRIKGDHVISTLNSTTAPLGSNATFTGQWEDVQDYVSILTLVNTDHLAASDSIRIDFSTDGVNLDRSIPVSFSTGGDFCSFPCQAKFFRLRIINGPVAQTFLRAQVQFNAVAESNKLIPLGDTVTTADAALLTKSTIIGKSSSGGGTFVDVKVNPSGSLLVEASTNGTPLSVAEEVSSGATTVSVAATTTPFTILAANANRKGATFYNTSATAKLYVTLGSNVSLTLFTIIVDPNGYYEVPFNYVGLVSAVFDSATGGANVTELT